MRADARRNRDRLLEAATELILEVGAEPPLDAIARQARVGIGTLYRHFPDREQLLSAVAERALEQSIEAAQEALGSSDEDDAALRRYVHAAVDRGVGVLNLVQPLLDAPDWSDQRSRIAPLLVEIVERGKRNGWIRVQVRVIDIVAAVIRFSRPLAIGLARDDERELAHRHLDIYLDGLRAPGEDGNAWPESPVLGRWSD